MNEKLRKRLDAEAKTIDDLLKKTANDVYPTREFCENKWISRDKAYAILDEDFVVVPRVEYEGMVHVPRKQLLERIFGIDNPSNDYGEVCKQNRQYRVLLKELLEAKGFKGSGQESSGVVKK